MRVREIGFGDPYRPAWVEEKVSGVEVLRVIGFRK